MEIWKNRYINLFLNWQWSNKIAIWSNKMAMSVPLGNTCVNHRLTKLSLIIFISHPGDFNISSNSVGIKGHNSDILKQFWLIFFLWILESWIDLSGKPWWQRATSSGRKSQKFLHGFILIVPSKILLSQNQDSQRLSVTRCHLGLSSSPSDFQEYFSVF